MLTALGSSELLTGPLKSLGAHAGALSQLKHLPSIFSPSRGVTNGGRHSALYVTDVDNNPTSHMPLLLGLVNYFERHMPYGKIAAGQCQCTPTAAVYPASTHHTFSPTLPAEAHLFFQSLYLVICSNPWEVPHAFRT